MGAGAVPAGGAARSPRCASRPWRWLTRRRLSTRLIAGTTLLLAAACAGVGVTSYAVLKKSLMSSLDGQLQAATGRYLACQQGKPSGDPDDTSRCGMIMGQAAGTFNADMVNGTFRTASIVRGRCDLSAADKATLRALLVYTLPRGEPPPSGDSWTPQQGGAPRQGVVQRGGGEPHGGATARLAASHVAAAPPKPVNVPAYTRNLASIGGDFRLTAVRGEDGQVLLTGLPLSSVEDTLSRVELGEIAVFGAVVLLAGVLGTGLVRLNLRPLRRVAATAALVSELPLETGEVVLPPRVPDTDPGTEVGQVGAAFNRMLGRVESALARREASENRLRRFAADASHELRTPLSAIRGYAELALRHRGPVPADVTHALRRVESESARMSVLVDELLLLARLDAGRPLVADPVDLSRLAIDATSDARAARPRHRWLLQLPDEPVLVRGDEHRLHQMLANLLSNAGKHTPPGTTVTVALHAADTVRLTVADDGPGIPDHLLPDLFERFVRGDTSRSHTADRAGAGGTGLGLAIVDAVVAAHHGSVGVTSRPGSTCFTITLPRLQQSQEAEPTASPPDRSASRTGLS